MSVQELVRPLVLSPPRHINTCVEWILSDNVRGTSPGRGEEATLGMEASHENMVIVTEKLSFLNIHRPGFFRT